MADMVSIPRDVLEDLLGMARADQRRAARRQGGKAVAKDILRICRAAEQALGLAPDERFKD